MRITEQFDWVKYDLLMDELRQLSGSDSDGDTLVRKAVDTTPGKLAFSDCQTNNAKQVTEGLKLTIQSLYKGVRNPSSHGWKGFGRVTILVAIFIAIPVAIPAA